MRNWYGRMTEKQLRLVLEFAKRKDGCKNVVNCQECPFYFEKLCMFVNSGYAKFSKINQEAKKIIREMICEELLEKIKNHFLSV